MKVYMNGRLVKSSASRGSSFLKRRYESSGIGQFLLERLNNASVEDLWNYSFEVLADGGEEDAEAFAYIQKLLRQKVDPIIYQRKQLALMEEVEWLKESRR